MVGNVFHERGLHKQMTNMTIKGLNLGVKDELLRAQVERRNSVIFETQQQCLLVSSHVDVDEMA
jgi:hypothetical protein